MFEITRIPGFQDGNQRKFLLKLSIGIILLFLIFNYMGKTDTFLTNSPFVQTEGILTLINLAGVVLAVMGWRIHTNRF